MRRSPRRPCWARNSFSRTSMSCTPATSRPSIYCRPSGPERLEVIQHQAAHLIDLGVFRGEERRISPQHRPALGAQYAVEIAHVAFNGLKVGILAPEQRLDIAVGV